MFQNYPLRPLFRYFMYILECCSYVLRYTYVGGMSLTYDTNALAFSLQAKYADRAAAGTGEDTANICV
jgi:hypothetical protein